MTVLLSLLFGPVKWLIEGFKLLAWVRPRQNDLRAQQKAYIRGEEVPQTLTDELELRKHQAASGWLRVLAILCGVQFVIMAWFGIGWRASDAVKDEVEAKLADAELQVAAARRERDGQVQIVRDQEQEIAGYKAKISGASLAEEARIAVNTKTKTAFRKARAASESKRTITERVDPSEWLRIESAGSRDTDS